MNFLVMDVESSETGEVAPGLTDAFTRVYLAKLGTKLFAVTGAILS